MIKFKRYINLKQILTWLFIILSSLFFIALIVFKEDLTDYSSRLKRANTDTHIKTAQLHRIDSLYNYVKNGLPYQITFLEFGAKGCSACKKMEGVMDEIKTKFYNRVNVNFINVNLPENQKIMEYYGVVVIPTQILLDKRGNEFFRHIGYYSADDLSKKF